MFSTLFIRITTLASLLFATAVYADVPPVGTSQAMSTAGSHRREKTAGFYLSILGEPFSIMGINGAYNILDFARVTAGVGWLGGDAITLGGGLKFMVPNLSLTPIVGLNGVVVVGTTAAGSRATGSAAMLANFGLDFTSQDGLNLGTGVQVPLAGASGVVPYINVGYFF